MDYQYVFTADFTLADMSLAFDSWYSIPFDLSGLADKVYADYVIFSIDDMSYECKFREVKQGPIFHFIGNGSPVLGADAGEDVPFCLLICVDDSSLSRLYLHLDLVGPVFHGNKETVHVAVSVAYHEATPTGFISSIFDVFSYIGGFVIGLLNSVTGLFWFVNGSGEIKLTLLGVLSLVALGVSLVFLLLRVIRNFLHFRS